MTDLYFDVSRRFAKTPSKDSAILGILAEKSSAVARRALALSRTMRGHVQGINIMTDDTSSSSQQVQAVLAGAADIRARELMGAEDRLHLPDAWLFARLVAAREVRDEMALLGVPQPQLHALFRRYFAQVDPPPPARSTLLQSKGHAEFVVALINLLLAQIAPTVLSDDARCLAAIIAHACLRPDHLWRDLGLNGRDDVTQMLERYFPTLVARNVEGLRWKKFLARELALSIGGTPGPAPGCPGCEDFRYCFPEGR
jgi:nitrogen fixation protein NifQ